MMSVEYTKCIAVFAQHQNGSIVDGLTVWKSNVDKRFAGVEECYICYFILHGANHSLPKVIFNLFSENNCYHTKPCKS